MMSQEPAKLVVCWGLTYTETTNGLLLKGRRGVGVGYV